MEMDPAAAAICEERFMMGVHHSGNRQGIFDMEDACAQRLPAIVAPNRYRITGWLQSRLKRAKDGSEETVEEIEGCGAAYERERMDHRARHQREAVAPAQVLWRACSHSRWDEGDRQRGVPG